MDYRLLKKLIAQVGKFDPLAREAWHTSLSKRFPQAIVLLEQRGVWGEEAVVAKWDNVGRHCFIEAAAGYVLAKALSANADNVGLACLIHDANKRRDKEAILQLPEADRGKALAQRECHGKYEYGEYGIPDDVVTLSQSNIPKTWDPAITPLGRTPEAMIVHLMDMITADGYLVTPDLRLPAVEQPGKFEGFYTWFRSVYGGVDIGVVQRVICAQVIDHFEQQLGLRPRTLIHWLNYQVDLGPEADIDFGEFKAS